MQAPKARATIHMCSSDKENMFKGPFFKVVAFQERLLIKNCPPPCHHFDSMNKKSLLAKKSLLERYLFLKEISS